MALGLPCTVLGRLEIRSVALLSVGFGYVGVFDFLAQPYTTGDLLGKFHGFFGYSDHR